MSLITAIVLSAIFAGLSAGVGIYLLRYRGIVTEMLGMMIGMTMGMISGIAIGAICRSLMIATVFKCAPASSWHLS